MELKWADVKPSLFSLVMVTLMAVIGILFIKWAANMWPGPWTDTANAI